MSNRLDQKTAASEAFKDAFGDLLRVEHARAEQGRYLLGAFKQAWDHHKTVLDEDERLAFAPVIDAVYAYEDWASTH